MQNQILNNWQEVRADKLCLRVTDGTHDTPTRLLRSGHPLITSKQLKGGKIEETDYYISDQDFYEVNKRSKVDQWDVLFGMIGTVGDMVIVRDEDPQFAIKNVGLFKTGGDEILAKWLYYYINSALGKTYIKSTTRGTSQGYVPLESLREFPIKIPKQKTELKDITNFLSAFDDKIEVNNNIAKTLEEMAQAIFKEWFVKFRFPGHEKIRKVDSELGKIPEGWKIEKLGKLIDLDRGVSYNGAGLTTNGLPMINLGCFLRGGKFTYESLKFYSGTYRYSQLIKEGDIVIANTDITQNREIIGNPAIVNEFNGYKTFLFTHHVFAMRNNSEYSNYFFYFLLRTHSFRNRAAGFATGTNVLALPKDALLELPLVLPPYNIASQFSEMAANALRICTMYEKENQKLAEMRDLLLPKLMKGEIRV